MSFRGMSRPKHEAEGSIVSKSPVFENRGWLYVVVRFAEGKEDENCYRSRPSVVNQYGMVGDRIWWDTRIKTNSTLCPFLYCHTSVMEDRKSSVMIGTDRTDDIPSVHPLRMSWTNRTRNLIWCHYGEHWRGRCLFQNMPAGEQDEGCSGEEARKHDLSNRVVLMKIWKTSVADATTIKPWHVSLHT